MNKNNIWTAVAFSMMGFAACSGSGGLDVVDGAIGGQNNDAGLRATGGAATGGAGTGGGKSGGKGGSVDGGVAGAGGRTNAGGFHFDGGSGGFGGTGGVISAPNRDLDVVFVIDNSGSMKEEQASLRQNFPAFIEELGKLPGGLPNLHIAVLSSDVGAGNIAISGNPACNRPGGDRGIFQARAGCGLEPNERFLVSLNKGADRNFTGTLADAFSCIADLGVSGCGYEHQLQSLRVGLATNITPQNAGFLRPDAALLVVILSDEDDCSAPPDSDLFVDPAFSQGMQASVRCGLVGHVCNNASLPPTGITAPLFQCMAAPNGGGRLIPVSEIVDFMLSLKPKNPDRIVVSAIAGWPVNPAGAAYTMSRDPMRMNLLDVEPACASAGGTAAPALRLKAFVDAFGGNLETICNADLRPALARIAAKVARTLAP